MESAFIEKREQQFLYKDSADFVVMDNETFEQRRSRPKCWVMPAAT